MKGPSVVASGAACSFRAAALSNVPASTFRFEVKRSIVPIVGPSIAHITDVGEPVLADSSAAVAFAAPVGCAPAVSCASPPSWPSMGT